MPFISQYVSCFLFIASVTAFKVLDLSVPEDTPPYVWFFKYTYLPNEK